MVPYEVLERARSVRDRVSGRPRISVTELSRSKEWREILPEAGVIEITDRGDRRAQGPPQGLSARQNLSAGYSGPAQALLISASLGRNELVRLLNKLR